MAVALVVVAVLVLLLLLRVRFVWLRFKTFHFQVEPPFPQVPSRPNSYVPPIQSKPMSRSGSLTSAYIRRRPDHAPPPRKQIHTAHGDARGNE